MIRFLSDDEIINIYPGLFKRIFGYENNVQAPSVVVVIEEDEKMIGFLSGYWTDKINFYIQYCGIMPRIKGSKFIMNAFRFIMDNLGAKSYSTNVPNTHTFAMIALINTGFIVHGVRQDMSGQLYVEWIKVKE